MTAAVESCELGMVELGEAPEPKDDFSTTESIPNGSSVAVNLLDQTESEIRVHPQYVLPPRVTHPLEENVAWSFARSLAVHLVGLLVGLPLALLVAVALLIALPIRVCLHLLSLCLPSALCPRVIPICKTHCNPWWPLSTSVGSSGQMQSVVSVQSAVSVSEARQQIGERIVHRVGDPSGRRQFQRFTQVPAPSACLCNRWTHDQQFHIVNHVLEVNRSSTPCGSGAVTKRSSSDDGSASTPRQRTIRLSSVKDLEFYMNNCAAVCSNKRSPWSVKLVPEFGNVQEGTSCALILLELNAQLTDQLCVLRFLSLWTDGRLTFDVEPKFRRSVAVSGSNVPPYNFFLNISYALWTACRLLTVAPLRLLCCAAKDRAAVWRHAASGTITQTSRKRRISAAVKKYRVSTTTSLSADHRASSMCSSALINGTDLNLTKRVTWTRIPNMDQVFRAERILRCATVELLLSFVSGALRRHFRAQGIKHPPNVQICVPVSNRDYLPIGRHAPCDFVLLPLEAPTGIEGNIPRLWHVQRKLADTLDDSFSLAIKVARTVCDLVLPCEWSGLLLSRTHVSSGCMVSFVRASGDVHVCGKKIHSVLLHTPLPVGVVAAFNFVQSGTEMLVSLTADTRVFAEPEKLMSYLQADIGSLLKQLSVRLLTLSQATFLPSYQTLPKMSSRGTPRDRQTPLCPRLDNMSAVAQGDWQNVQATLENQSEDMETDSLEGESLEELERLLSTVNSELEIMKANPQGDRMEYVAKLAELERKMEAFHRSISQRLGPAATSILTENVDFGAESSAVHALLEPYRDEGTASPERRYSRDVRRDSVVQRLLRRRSRRLDSPTRRLSTASSPRPRESFDAQLP